ncbi:lauroyl-Kdo(2)-lipid IV(A) myristoyltransferase [Parashewanella spongiae]|uniref:Lauroyl-Kdo(2)-lipid IV(A) myristoyltransferase n=1 Tax=Parashewanella spongiae TaxID=342950 RepID=A0A3A6U181_9GAMM|nr:lauroyl-Kdo(2)-lipid IV(A) myristoyltransferase [Parashewanella spongiae]MCL1076832.1 lauroyl-Kdo(2)-lipid IV(A) myristoyltransferase [Parashewanella spongiae]RJY19200.1 lauroyl-Kdo(2)-lipid IV(A) myristoyltransferase [Parashewanella spongiae]
MSGRTKKFCCKFHRGLLHPKLWLSWVGVFILFLFGLLPVKVRAPLACLFAKFVKMIAKRPLRIARANLAACFPEKSEHEIDELLKENVSHFVMTMLAQAELLCCSEKKLKQRVKLSGAEHIAKARMNGKPIIFILPHVWGVEYAGLRLNLELPMVAMAKAHRNELFNWFSIRLRSSRGGDVYKREAGIRTLVGELKKGNSFFYLPDEDLGSKKSVFAPFFATVKATLPVVGRLAHAGNAEVLPVAMGYNCESHQFELTVKEACCLNSVECKESEALVLNKMIEETIKEHPEQYMWFLKVLKTRPDGFKSVYL